MFNVQKRPEAGYAMRDARYRTQGAVVNSRSVLLRPGVFALNADGMARQAGAPGKVEDKALWNGLERIGTVRIQYFRYVGEYTDNVTY